MQDVLYLSSKALDSEIEFILLAQTPSTLENTDEIKLVSVHGTLDSKTTVTIQVGFPPLPDH